MRHGGPLLLWLTLMAASAARADDEKPVLVLDVGGHTSSATEVVFTPDGKEVISVSYDKTIRTWDVATGEPLRVLRPPIGPGSSGMLYAVAIAPDGRTLAVAGFGIAGGEKPIYLISLPGGQIVRVMKGHGNAIMDLEYSPDGTRLASGSIDRTARIWDVATGRTIHILQGHTEELYDVAWHPDGSRLATASTDRTARIWATATGAAIATLSGAGEALRSVAWRPDGAALATGGNGNAIRIWSPDGAALPSYDDPGMTVVTLNFTADSRRVLVTGNRTTGASNCAILDLASGKAVVRFARHTDVVWAAALSPDGTLAATADRMGYIHLWRTDDGAPVHTLTGRGDPIYRTAWSADGKAIAWGTTWRPASLHDRGPLERTFRLPDLTLGGAPDSSYKTARPTRGSLTLESDGKASLVVARPGSKAVTLTVPRPNEEIMCFIPLADDRAAVGSNFGLLLYDVNSGSQVRTFEGHTGIIWSIAPSPDGRHFLSASEDRTLRLWALDHDEPLLSLFFAGNDWVAWTPEGYYAASPGGEKLMGWHVGHGPGAMADFFPAAQFRKSLYRPDVLTLVQTTGSTDRALELADRAKGKATERVEIAEVLPPSVAITSPDVPGMRVPGLRLEVKAVANSVGKHPITALRLLLDGRPYRGQGGVREVVAPRLGETRASWSIALEPGPHTLAVQADSAVSRGVSRAVDVVADGEAPVVLPALYVLAIGVSAYPGNLRLNYAASDAEAVAGAFRARSKDLFREVEVRLLTDRKATRAEVLKGLAWLRKQMTQRDVGVIFFSGHGQKDADGLLYLLPVDVDPEELLATAVPGNQLKETLAGIPGRVITLLDACHAGAAGGDRRKGTGGLTDDLVRDLVTDDYGVVTMASSMGSEESLESAALRQGYFTRALVEGLSGAADFSKDGVVYLSELDTYITDRVKALSKGHQHPVTAKPTSIRSFPLSRP